MDFRDVTLAYDDDTKGIMGSRDVTLAHDDDTRLFQFEPQQWITPLMTTSWTFLGRQLGQG